VGLSFRAAPSDIFWPCGNPGFGLPSLRPVADRQLRASSSYAHGKLDPDPGKRARSASEAGINGGSAKTSSRYSLMMADSQSFTFPCGSSGTLPWGEICEKLAGLFLRSTSIGSAATPFSASARRTRCARAELKGVKLKHGVGHVAGHRIGHSFPSNPRAIAAACSILICRTSGSAWRCASCHSEPAFR
jgi:hypothetical protein